MWLSFGCHFLIYLMVSLCVCEMLSFMCGFCVSWKFVVSSLWFLCLLKIYQTYCNFKMQRPRFYFLRLIHFLGLYMCSLPLKMQKPRFYICQKLELICKCVLCVLYFKNENVGGFIFVKELRLGFQKGVSKNMGKKCKYTCLGFCKRTGL